MANSSTTATKLMVQLQTGYGDGYGIVSAIAGKPAVEVQRPAPTRYTDHGTDAGPLEDWKRDLLAAPYVVLTDSGVRVPSGAIVRVVGPLDCPEAIRVRARRALLNCDDRGNLDRSTDDEICAAYALFASHGYGAGSDALHALVRKYAL